MKKIITALTLSALLPLSGLTETNLALRLSGRILIQVEDRGQAWYINPDDHKRYSLGRPSDAFTLIKKLGIGITNTDLNKIEPQINNEQADSDNDGYNDGIEIRNNYDPFGPDKLDLNATFANKNAGKIFIQTEKRGEAWYVDPNNKKRRFLNSPSDAFQIMKSVGLGITDNDLRNIPIGMFYNGTATRPASPNKGNLQENVLSSAAQAFRDGNKDIIAKYFIPSLENAVKKIFDYLDKENLLTLGNILSGSRLEKSTETKKTYFNEIYFNGEKIPVRFYVERINGVWLMTNL